MKKSSGIYMIFNKGNGKVYIGQTINLKKREKKHFLLLEGNKHHNYHLQRAFNKYGKENFEFRIVEECDPLDLDVLEIAWIDYFKSRDIKKGYNMNEGGDGNKGWKHSEETRRKMSQVRKGKKIWLGKHHSDETKKKMAEALKGKNNPLFGKHHSNESKKRMSEVKKGKHHSDETKRKISEAKKGTIYRRN